MPVAVVNTVPIAYQESGEGELVVLVHGSTSSAPAWTLVAEALVGDHRVVTFDRRGRGGSGDEAHHSLDREVADLVGLLDHLGGPAHLVAHSYGARVALAAAPQLRQLASFVVYEPPLAPERVPQATWDAIDNATAAQDWAAVLAEFYPLAAVSDDEVALIRSIPGAWDRALDGARTVAREGRALLAAPLDPGTLRTVEARSLVLVGSRTTAPIFLDGLAEVAAALDAPIQALPDQGHLAQLTGPEGLAAAIRAHVRG